MEYSVVGLDIETSTSDASTGTLLSIGVVDYGDVSRREYWEVWHDYLSLSPKAMRVNKIDVFNLDKPGNRPLSEVDQLLYNWLLVTGKRCIPVGFNVGGFDMVFVRKYLPLTGRSLGWRSIDLNALCFTEALKTGQKFETIKKSVKAVAIKRAKQVLPELEQHNALFDAMIAVYVLQHFTDLGG